MEARAPCRGMGLPPFRSHKILLQGANMALPFKAPQAPPTCPPCLPRPLHRAPRWLCPSERPRHHPSRLCHLATPASARRLLQQWHQLRRRRPCRCVDTVTQSIFLSRGGSASPPSPLCCISPTPSPPSPLYCITPPHHPHLHRGDVPSGVMYCIIPALPCFDLPLASTPPFPSIAVTVRPSVNG